MQEKEYISITSESLRDFQTCARLYDYRHNETTYEPIGRRELIADRFDNTLKRVLSFFFYKKQGGIIPSYSALLSRWERLWFPKDMSSYDLAVEQHESSYGNLASFSNEASIALLKFYEDFGENDNTDPIMIDEKFTVPLFPDMRVEGSFDLCTRDAKTKDFRIIQWSASLRRPPASKIMMDFAVLYYAFMYRQNEDVRASYYLYDLTSVKDRFIEVEVLAEDVNTLKYWASEIKDEEIYPSRRGLTYYCKSCPFDSICKTWKFPSLIEEEELVYG